ncbi:MAG: hypothetical protein Q8L68_05400 [Methylococcales bacterium]|nr:hypothetical protein [Methylococcales bacterium]
MKVYQIALALLIFSATTTMINELGIFNYKLYEAGYQVNQSDADSIYQVDQSGIASKESWTDQLADTLGISWVLKAAQVIYKTLSLALNLGSLFTMYVPGTVGDSFKILFNTVTYFIYAWGGVQLWRKVSSK